MKSHVNKPRLWRMWLEQGQGPSRTLSSITRITALLRSYLCQHFCKKKVNTADRYLLHVSRPKGSTDYVSDILLSRHLWSGCKYIQIIECD